MDALARDFEQIDERLVRAAEGLCPELAARADEIEATRRLPQDIADKLTQASLHAVCNPVSHGGAGAAPATYARVVETLARADASAAWCAFIAITSAYSIASASTDDTRALLQTPGVLTAGVFAPSGRAKRTVRDGVAGYVVSGRWSWGSGSQNADWVSGGSFVVDDDGNIMKNEGGRPRHVAMIFRADDVTFLDTWSVMGLQGTGSTDYTVDSVFVPEGRTIDRFGQRASLSDPIFLFPNFGMLAIGIGAVALGAARAMIEDLQSFAGKKVPQGNSRALADKPMTQTGIAKAEATLRAGRAFFYEAINDAWQGARRNEMTVAHRRDLRLATAHAVNAAKSCAEIIYELAGGTAVYRTSPIQRRLRDIQVAGQHMMVNQATYELVGRLLLDRPTDIEQL
jgi:alkylation response protein AidB-like acyl-CoA dehydrogenase